MRASILENHLQRTAPADMTPDNLNGTPSETGDFSPVWRRFLFMNDIRRYARLASANGDIFHEGDKAASVIWVLKGWVGTYRLFCDGRRQFVDMAAPVYLIENAGADGALAVNSVTALTDAIVAVYPRAVLETQRKEFPELDHIVGKLRDAASARHAQRILSLGRGTARERVAAGLLELYIHARSAGFMRRRDVHLPLRQKDIGDLTGLTAVHVCRTLRQFSEDGVVATGDFGTSIRDVHRLAEICEIDFERYAASVSVLEPTQQEAA